MANAVAERDMATSSSEDVQSTTVRRDLVEYVRLLLTLLPTVVIAAALVVGAVSLVSSAFWAREAAHWATPAAMIAVVWLSYACFMTSMSLCVRPEDYRRAIFSVAMMCAYVATSVTGIAMLLPPRGAAHRLGVLYALVLPTFQLTVTTFSCVQTAGRSWPFPRILMSSCAGSGVAVGYALCIAYAALVQQEDTSAVADIFFSGILYPSFTAGLVRLVYADLFNLVLAECSPSAARRHDVCDGADGNKIGDGSSSGCDGGPRCESRQCGAFVTLVARVPLMGLTGSYSRQAFHSIGVWVQLRMASPVVFAASLALSTLLELLGTYAYFLLLGNKGRPTSVVPLAGATVNAASVHVARQHSRALRWLPGFVRFWLDARAQEDWRAKLSVLFYAEEVGERINIMSLGIALIALEVLLPGVQERPDVEPNLGFAAAKFAALVIAEMVEDITKKRMLRAACASEDAVISVEFGAVQRVMKPASAVSWFGLATLSVGPLLGVCTYFVVQ